VLNVASRLATGSTLECLACTLFRTGLSSTSRTYGNLATILSDGGLHCDSRMTGEGRSFRECANDGIKGVRRRKAVSCSPGTVVADYVPFYYATRSAMMSSSTWCRR
jgi:hypothetical protein